MLMMKKIKILFNICILLFVYSSCSITKRHYLPGYSIERKEGNFKKNTTVFNENNSSIEIAKSEKKLFVVDSFDSDNSSDEMPLTAATDKAEGFENLSSGYSILNKPKIYTSKRSIEGCDKIFFKSGEGINAKVLEISQAEIKYRKCEDLNGEAIIIRKSDVLKIKYSNGTMEEINPTSSTTEDLDYYSPPTKDENPKYTGNPVINKFALASLILAVLSIIFFPLIPLPVIFGIIALKQFKKNPGAYKGKWMAISGLILAGIIILFIIAFILLFILFLMM